MTETIMSVARPRALREDARGEPTTLLTATQNHDAGVVDTVVRALDRKQGMLAFQPVMSAADPSRAAFHEALIRITDDSGRVVPAGEFIATVEDTEIGRRIDCLALELGLRELACEPSLRLAVNMSARSIGYRPWGRVLEAGLGARAPTLASGSSSRSPSGRRWACPSW